MSEISVTCECRLRSSNQKLKASGAFLPRLGGSQKFSMSPWSVKRGHLAAWQLAAQRFISRSGSLLLLGST